MSVLGEGRFSSEQIEQVFSDDYQISVTTGKDGGRSPGLMSRAGEIPYHVTYPMMHVTLPTSSPMNRSMPNAVISTSFSVVVTTELTGVKMAIFTVRNSSCGKVMFSQASVILGEGCVVVVHGRGALGCMSSRGRAWQERRPLQVTVRILLECILVINVINPLSSHYTIISICYRTKNTLTDYTNKNAFQ